MNEFIRVAAFTAGVNAPSARFRLRQFHCDLRNQGILVTENIAPLGTFPPRNRPVRPFWAAASIASRIPSVIRSWAADVTFLQREMLSTFMTLEPLTSPPRILDVDDAIHLHRGGAFARRIAQRCDLIICGNANLADQFGQWNKRIEILPTAVDSDVLVPALRDVSSSHRNTVIGWIGTSANHPYLQSIEPSLAQVLARTPNATLLIVSDRAPELPLLDQDRLEFRQWSARTEAADIQSMDIGIMPLEDTPWARGKCSFKMLQYMSCGLPVVVSPVGMNANVLAHGPLGLSASNQAEWTEALLTLLQDTELRERFGATAREVICEHYSVKAIAPRLGAAIRSVL